jgi:hypothetical protein
MLTWWDGSSWTDRRTPIPGGPLDPKTATGARKSDDDVPPGELGDDDAGPQENSGPIPVIESSEPSGEQDPVFADPTSVFAPVSDPSPSGDYHRPTEDRPRPRLLLVLLPLFFIGLAAAALIATAGSDDDSDNPKKNDDSDQLTTIGEAVQVAERAGLPIDLAGSTVGSLIDDICGAAGNEGSDASLATRIAGLPVQPDQVHDLLNALGKGAAVRCPDAVATDSGLLLRTGELAIGKLGPATSTTLATTGTSEVAAPPVTEETTATTRKPTTATTRKPPPPTTAAPTTVTTSAAPTCNANYSACLSKSTDYDCIGKAGDPDWQRGDGPNFVSGPITVTGSDVFDLDVDGNGIACERAPQT